MVFMLKICFETTLFGWDIEIFYQVHDETVIETIVTHTNDEIHIWPVSELPEETYNKLIDECDEHYADRHNNYADYNHTTQQENRI
jgi:hypothetical protein